MLSVSKITEQPKPFIAQNHQSIAAEQTNLAINDTSPAKQENIAYKRQDTTEKLAI